jgi:hypothetical protein
MTFCLWSLTYSGHLTNRVKSALGGKSPPIPNDLDFFSKRGFWAVFLDLAPPAVSIGGINVRVRRSAKGQKNGTLKTRRLTRGGGDLLSFSGFGLFHSKGRA